MDSTPRDCQTDESPDSSTRGHLPHRKRRIANGPPSPRHTRDMERGEGRCRRTDRNQWNRVQEGPRGTSDTPSIRCLARLRAKRPRAPPPPPARAPRPVPPPGQTSQPSLRLAPHRSRPPRKQQLLFGVLCQHPGEPAWDVNGRPAPQIHGTEPCWGSDQRVPLAFPSGRLRSPAGGSRPRAMRAQGGT